MGNTSWIWDEHRVRALLLHWLESTVVAVLAGMLAAALCIVAARPLATFLEMLVRLGMGNTIIGILVLISTITIQVPRHVWSMIKGVGQFPLHVSILMKVVGGTVVCSGLVRKFGSYGVDSAVGLSGWLVLVLALGVVALARCLVLFGPFIITRIGSHNSSQRASLTTKHATVEQDPQEPDLDSWLSHDVPVTQLCDNRVPSHRWVAKRILRRLLVSPDLNGALSSVALIGPYGSGKTSICNLVQSLYREQQSHGVASRHTVLFCRFEAWQYLSPEGAVRGLLETAASKILEVADVPALWSVPKRYVDAMREGSGWTRVLATLVGEESMPKSLLQQIGNVLDRLGKRLVIFVDDFDRIESRAPEIQRALTQALNQLQGVRNIQYGVSVGQIEHVPDGGKVVLPAHDLLKITRYQESVPRLEGNVVVELARQLRSRALADSDSYYPWAEVSANEPDPLTWHGLHISFLQTQLAGMLLELLDTPRALKGAFRETKAAWEGGLKGEINWYHLLLANALRMAEPTLFEWIERDREVFIEGPHLTSSVKAGSKEDEAERLELQRQVLGSLERNSEKRQKAVFRVLEELFPAFGGKLPGPHFQKHSSASIQGMSDGTIFTRSYFERFLSGRLDENEVPDQPTLRYLHRLLQEEFNPREFEVLYLETYEKQTGPLNKITEFAKFLSFDNALRIADTILSWIALPEHSRSWLGGPREFHASMMHDAYMLLERCGTKTPSDLEDLRARARNKEQRIVGWVEQVIAKYAEESWYAISALLYVLGPTRSATGGRLSSDEANRLKSLFSEELRKWFVERKKQLLPTLLGDRFLIYDFTRVMRTHEQFNTFKAAFTQEIIDQVAADDSGMLRAYVIISMVGVTSPSKGPDIPVQARTFTVDKAENDRRYDMTILLAALKEWVRFEIPDPVAAAAWEKLRSEYGLDG